MVSPESRLRVALRVFRPPVLAQVEVRGKRPVRIFSAAGVRGEIVSASGPWRTSGDWWTTRAWERDEWDVAVVSPGATQSSDVSCKKHRKTALYRIYRDPSSGNWFVQGTYD